jgi:hypothetical protein
MLKSTINLLFRSTFYFLILLIVFFLIDCSGGEKTATEGIPKDKRHIKATYANSTPVTDGRYVVTFFGSEGLFAFDMEGKFLWKKDLGRINCGAYDVPSYEWGSATSPIIFEDKVIVQCDTQEDDFILACDMKPVRKFIVKK